MTTSYYETSYLYKVAIRWLLIGFVIGCLLNYFLEV